MQTNSEEVTVVISPRHTDKLPTVYEAHPGRESAEIYCKTFNRINHIYKAEIKKEEN